MNPQIDYYRPNGEPAMAAVTVNSVPTATPTVTINGVVFTFGTDFWGQTPAEVARSLTAAINAERSSYGTLHRSTTPFRVFWAMFYGPLVRLVASKPGTGGNSYTLATSDAVAFTVSGATFSGGAA